MGKRSYTPKGFMERDTTRCNPRRATQFRSDEVSARFKRTSIGTIPEDWNLCTCGKTCIKIQDGTHFSPRLGGADFLYVTSRNIGVGVLDVSNAERISEIQHRKIYTRCDTRHGDLLLTKDGANTGNAAINNLKEECSLLSSVAFLRFDPRRHDARFFLQFILSREGQRQIKDLMSGNAITRLTVSQIRRLRIPCPRLKEQKCIATTLSDADALIESLDRLIAKKRAIKQAAMQQLLTGETRLPGFETQWNEQRLGDVAAFHKGSGLPKSALSENGRQPCVHYGELFTHYGEKIRNVTSRTNIDWGTVRALQNDVLMPTSDVTPNGLATASAVGVPDVVVGGDVLVIRAPETILDGEFLAYAIRMHRKQVMQLVSGTTVFHIYGRDMAQFVFAAPDIDEQRAITKTLSDMDAEIQALERRREKARQIKQGMMQELLTGRTRLVEPNPGVAEETPA